MQSIPQNNQNNLIYIKYKAMLNNVMKANKNKQNK